MEKQVIVNTQFEVGIRQRSPVSTEIIIRLITVIYLLLGQDNSSSAGDVDLAEERKGREEHKSHMTHEDG